MPVSRESGPEPDPILPIAIGFYLLALPLWVAIALAPTPTGRWTNAAAALLLSLLGVATQLRRR
jgi:hypothetical protein